MQFPDVEEPLADEEDDVFGEGLPTRLPEIMLVGSQSFSPGGPNGIIRSQSFAGFSGLQERRSRCNSFIENSSALKKPQTKLKKMHNLGHKNNNPPKEPQPTRVEEVYRALKKGLSEYLDVHQTELDKLTTQLRDMKRNSRLVGTPSPVEVATMGFWFGFFVLDREGGALKNTRSKGQSAICIVLCVSKGRRGLSSS